MRLILKLLIILLPGFVAGQDTMMYGDTSRRGVPFSKDPHVIRFNNSYLMYYSVPPYPDENNPIKGWGIGIAESNDLENWNKISEITPKGEYEKKGLCAPCALVIKDTVHLFYQTYGNGRNDAICHAKSNNGIDFIRNPTNPVFRPHGKWNCGRAIDAEVIKYQDRYLLYFATRDTGMSIQMQGVAAAPAGTNFNKNDWQQLVDYPILKPELPWERQCVEGASVIQRGEVLYMFYAGAYNNKPQQVGIASSKDGIKWTRLLKEPFLSNGKPGEWNSSESGHPHIFEDADGKTWLFFQGNNDNGKTWYLSKKEVKWNKKGPFLREK
jgi:beta-1,2-mannobiose phosphorylase / 1,2-beta-oligomannan phosphorylase